ncbi:uncharacterized protein K452DRAFT_286750 [Aplosporella prunicola CBS 121167]|uniref:Uncharacterized protein n=1 Tax=Aplosporella prunicola CBS 121167 TaxID=1176127 RepID=A0A6A6BGD4_9PEZI|nr:uncharacterized protein K452DRAFT_286750 [Aplosporella prunicola CBS 121167]KAF2142324.1 hypothetical protein K452DRAFT_286750 [Aplosporella prunicola CBS 121167]
MFAIEALRQELIRAVLSGRQSRATITLITYSPNYLQPAYNHDKLLKPTSKNRTSIPRTQSHANAPKPSPHPRTPPPPSLLPISP